MNQEEIGKKIKKLRLTKKLTQNDLADKLGVTYQAVSKWENGKSLPDIEQIKNICSFFKVEIDYLIGNKKKKNRKKIGVGILIVILIIFILSIEIVIHKNTKFEFKTMSTTCEKFTLDGSVAFNKKSTSLYISNIKYCGDESEALKKMKLITCNLYEVYETNKNLVSSCEEKKNTNLKDFINDLKINVDNYTSMCKKINNANLVLEIESEDIDGNLISYKLPIKLEDNCLEEK